MSTISKNLPAPPNGFSTNLSDPISDTGLEITLNSVVGLGTEGVGVLFKKDLSGVVVASSVEYVHWTGISGNKLTLSDTGDRGVTGSYNGAQAFSSGDYFEVWVSSHYYSGTANLVEHNADGTHNFHALTEKTTPVDADEVALVDSAASNVLKKLTWANLKATIKTYFDTLYPPHNGWISASGTWTAVDGNSISVNADITAVIQKGDKIKCTNNSEVKYFYITTSPTFGTATTFDVTGESDLVSGAITLPYYSKIESPHGFKNGKDFYKFSAYRNAAQSISDATITKVQFNAENFDPNSNYDNATNYRYTAPISGYYSVNLIVGCTISADTTNMYALIYKNGGGMCVGSITNYNYTHRAQVSSIQYLVKGDYIEGYISQDSSGSKNTLSSAGDMEFSAHFLGC